MILGLKVMAKQLPKPEIKFSSTPLYDLQHRLTEEGIQLDHKTALSDPFILTSVPTNEGKKDLWYAEKVYRANERHNMIVSVFAPTAFYKSTFCFSECMTYQYIYYKLNLSGVKLWNARNIVYNSVELKQKVEELGKAVKEGEPVCTSILVDEQPTEVYGREMSFKVWSKDFEKQVRKLMINLYFSSPKLESHVHHFVVNMYDWNRQSRFMRAFVYTGDGTLIGSIILPMPTNDQLKVYNYVKDAHLMDVMSLKNKSVDFEKNIAVDLAGKQELFIDDVPGFPHVDFWTLTRSTQRQYVMLKYKIPVIAQANDILRMAYDFYIANFKQLPGLAPRRPKKG
jgi:hypothetical protein